MARKVVDTKAAQIEFSKYKREEEREREKASERLDDTIMGRRLVIRWC